MEKIHTGIGKTLARNYNEKLKLSLWSTEEYEKVKIVQFTKHER